METAIRCSIVLMALPIVNAVSFAWARKQPASVEALFQGDDAIEGRGADRFIRRNRLNRIDKALHKIDRTGLGLEIGPSHNPIAPKKAGFNVEVLDHATGELLMLNIIDRYESKSRGVEDTPEKVERFNNEIEFIKTQWSETLRRDPHNSKTLTLAREDLFNWGINE